ncbi:helix-turn-helix transcriptional regulator [Paraburkholderia caballeronis]|uniref:DNA-binding response regulator, NarL/FixJ family, contains REC and HTH domains n=1 Tax=Paraburkholderia caballeronis TaxID=416943 RepID=A0A1H7TCA5_9BURK|nr:response regulator transcription factor [Paraburkholderia caballeronis]PXW22609.1 LuxR family two component transcriptional regulator [Paraburkholderia caballeronis]PXW96712.1 LuxR family two component transcriptional regulator [Paraburkholderia caballeronis]RAJ93339.1 LuxR family two component transcriptional regulator [Paraburkholderia caballeronis]SEC66651.1 two component transcriptional regulator, LuxR family [Paraburkholderia caballeronis]SEL82373.1 DNA-binding response regulator, NarL
MRFAILNPDAERRDGLKALLRQIDRRARFNEASDWRGADRAMQRFPTSLLVIDWHDGIRPGELRAFTTKHPDVPVAVLVDNASTPALVRELLGEGAHGVIRRTTDSPLIVKLLEVTLLGGSHVPADVLHPVAPPVPPPRRFGASARPARKPLLTSTLSPRQQQIMRCVHMGSTNKMIARTLGISEGTVKIHLASIFQQLGAPNRAAAVAIYNGWLSSQLQVLHAQWDHPPKPEHGQRGPVPLRRRGTPAFRYPLRADDTANALPVAAEPTPPFGEPEPAGD